MICGIGAMSDGVPTEVPAHWRVYFGVTDADSAVETALDGGGQVQMESADTPYGRMAVLSDPQGGNFVIVGNR
jgi:predicted enzyme related to lactoylglutathione lyase